MYLRLLFAFFSSNLYVLSSVVSYPNLPISTYPFCLQKNASHYPPPYVLLLRFPPRSHSPPSEGQGRSYSAFSTCSLICSSSSFICTTMFCISAWFDFEPVVLISRPISWAIKPSFLP